MKLIQSVFGTLAALTVSHALAQTPPAAPPPTPAPVAGPTLAQSLKALDAAFASATKMNVRLTCAVLDSQGGVVALARMDGTRAFTTTVAEGKAFASSQFGQSSGAMAQMASNPAFAALNASLQNRLLPVQGALPIIRNNQIHGAIGCSGATSQQDEDAAKAAIAAL